MKRIKKSLTQKELVRQAGLSVSLNKVKIDKYTINYAISGKGKPLILLHSGVMGWMQWYKNIPEFSKHFKVYAIDLPGFGFSSPLPNFQKADLEKIYVSVLEGFIKKLNLGKVNIVGHSLGGWVTMKLAIKKPELIRKMVIESPLGLTRTLPLSSRFVSISFVNVILGKYLFKKTEKSVRNFFVPLFKDKTKIPTLHLSYILSTTDSQNCHLFRIIRKTANIFGLKERYLFKEDLYKLRTNTLFILGEKDPLVPSNFVIDTNNLVRKVIKDSGHVSSVERAQLFDKITCNFLLS